MNDEFGKKVAYELDRNRLMLEMLEVLNYSVDFQNDPIRMHKYIRTKMQDVCKALDIFEIAHNSPEFFRINDSDQRIEQGLSKECIRKMLSEYLEGKVAFGMERLEVMDSSWDYHLALTEVDIKHLVVIFKKLAAYDELNQFKTETLGDVCP